MRESSDPAHRAWAAMFNALGEVRARVVKLSAEFDLTPAQTHVLQLLDPNDPFPMSGVAEFLSCDASNVTGLVDRLESRQFVERRPAEHDRRVKHLVLTEAGTQVRDAMLAQLLQPPEFLKRLSSEELEQLLLLLAKAAPPEE